jgi:hypothetical protein
MGAYFSMMFIVITLVMATISFYGVETPLRMHRTRIKQALSYALLAMLMFGTTKGMAKVNQALSPPPLPIEYQRYADPATICHGQMVGDCLKGDLTSSNEVLVLGDSHAAMLNLFFDQLGKELGFKARIITASSCVTIPDFDYQRLPEWAHKACLAQIEQAKDHLSNAKVIFMAGMWSWQLQSNQFRKVFAEFLNTGAPNAHKYVLSQVPMYNTNPMRIQRFNALGLISEGHRDEEYKLANMAIKKITESNIRTTYLALDKIDLFKLDSEININILFYDESHMNEVGVKIYADKVKEEIKVMIKENF